ncbi:hypothetical protein LTR53_004035 [Teratosphaeriaceae sp. CCFEE 6253]|nr:hypothetical protein LTR53_004035 [Teratosphaeriaceae sp. CCFEE 6253]
MDWTGGTHRRFANRGNAGLLKQKQHFAKVRATLQNTPSSQRTFRPDYLHPTIAPLTKHRTQHGPYHESRGAAGGVERDTYTLSQRSDAGGAYRERTGSAQPRRPAAMPGHSGQAATSRVMSRQDVSPAKRSLNRPEEAEPLEDPLLADSRHLDARRRLLARRDWLGLSATRPLQMGFSSSHDRDRFGKRRRVKKTSRRGQPAKRRSLSPLFAERLMRPEHAMSGAPPREDIRIRIGTAALASQTLPSRASHTPKHTSMRPPSTDFGPLSEESMLLGDEGDGFEALDVAGPFKSFIDTSAEDLAHVPLPLVDAVDVQRVPESPDMHRLSDETARGLMSRDIVHYALDYEPAYAGPLSTSASQPGRPPFQARNISTAHCSLGPERSPALQRSETTTTGAGTHQTHTIAMNSVPDAGAEAEDDAMWRKLLHIEQDTSSHASLAALKSSSLHNTTSHSSHRADPFNDNSHGQGSLLSLSTPIGAGTQGAPFVQTLASSSGRSTNLQSPSYSLKHIYRLDEQPAQDEVPQAEEDADDNAAWRDFIIGSGDGGSESSEQLTAVAKPHTGTSANATQGETWFMSGDKASASSYAVQYGPPSGSEKYDPAADTTDNRDEIEDSTSPPQAEGSANIHAGLVRVQSRRQYMQSNPRPAAAKMNIVKRPLRRKTDMAKKYDIYDLPVSDETSYT